MKAKVKMPNTVYSIIKSYQFMRLGKEYCIKCIYIKY